MEGRKPINLRILSRKSLEEVLNSAEASGLFSTEIPLMDAEFDGGSKRMRLGDERLIRVVVKWKRLLKECVIRGFVVFVMWWWRWRWWRVGGRNRDCVAVDVSKGGIVVGERSLEDGFWDKAMRSLSLRLREVCCGPCVSEAPKRMVAVNCTQLNTCLDRLPQNDTIKR